MVKKPKRSGKNGFKGSIKMLAKRGMAVDKIITASLRLDSELPDHDEEEAEDNKFMGDVMRTSSTINRRQRCNRGHVAQF